MNNSNISREPPNIIHSEYKPQVVTESRQTIQGQKRIEYIPYEKTVIEYEPITKIEYVPRERKVVEYYPVEYQTEYIPQVYQEKVIEYVPVERLQQRVEYVPVERQIFYPPEEHPEFIEEGHRYETLQNQSLGNVYGSRGIAVTQPYQIQRTNVTAPPRVNSSRVQPGSSMNNMSFQNSGFYSPPPPDNTPYTKQPLPTSKRR